MAKKIVLALLIATIVTGALAAQANSRDNWLSGEVSLLGAGARYERMLSPKLSIGANAYWSSLFLFWNEIEIGGSVRFYPWGGMFFVGGGLGFHIHTGDMNYTYESGGYSYTGDWWGSITGVAITPEVGWKIDVGPEGGFFIQPGIKLPITLGSKKIDIWSYTTSKFGVGVGIVPYCGFGYAF